jgi:hypothetical protein
MIPKPAKEAAPKRQKGRPETRVIKIKPPQSRPPAPSSRP